MIKQVIHFIQILVQTDRGTHMSKLLKK